MKYKEADNENLKMPHCLTLISVINDSSLSQIVTSTRMARLAEKMVSTLTFLLLLSIGSRARFGGCYRIFLYVLTTIFLRFRKAYSFKNLKNKVSNCFFGLYGNNK